VYDESSTARYCLVVRDDCAAVLDLERAPPHTERDFRASDRGALHVIAYYHTLGPDLREKAERLVKLLNASHFAAPKPRRRSNVPHNIFGNIVDQYRALLHALD